MNKNLPEKIKLLSDIKMQTQIYKIIPALMHIDVDTLKENIDLLQGIGITIRHIQEVKICAIEPSELKRRIEYIKEHKKSQEFIKNPLLIMDKRNFEDRESAPIISMMGFRFPKKDEPIDKSDVAKVINNDSLSLNPENFDRYQLLSEAINNVVNSLSDANVIKDSKVFEALSKLVAANYGSDKDCIYEAMVYDRNYSNEQKDMIKKTIDDELSIVNRIGIGE